MIANARDIPLSNLEREILSELRSAALRLAAEGDGVASATVRKRPGPTRRPGVGSRVVAAGVAIAVAGGGIAAAAAAGLLPNPWAGSAARNIPFFSSPDPAALPGAKVKLSVRGPESATFEIVTDRVTNHGSPGNCEGLVVKEPRGRTSHLETGCGGAAAAVPVAAIVEWQAPSGVSYAIVWGPAPVGATKVALSSRSGVTGATGPTGGGYYLLYVPAQEMPEQRVLNFYNSSSHTIDSQQIASQPSPSP